MDKRDVHKTAFVSYNGLSTHFPTLFWSKNVPEPFQGAMDVVLITVKCQYTPVSIDEVIFFLKSLEEHLRHIEKVPRILIKAGVEIKLKRYSFFREIIE